METKNYSRCMEVLSKHRLQYVVCGITKDNVLPFLVVLQHEPKKVSLNVRLHYGLWLLLDLDRLQ